MNNGEVMNVRKKESITLVVYEERESYDRQKKERERKMVLGILPFYGGKE